MEFGWINLFGAGIVIIMMIPNILFALRYRVEKSSGGNRIMETVEQIGRYGCIVFMWLPLFVWKFGFGSVQKAVAYFIGNGLLLLAYWIIWGVYFRNRSRKAAVALAVLPTVIFFMSGMLLGHWALVVSSIVFGVGHICITVNDHRQER